MPPDGQNDGDFTKTGLTVRTLADQAAGILSHSVSVCMTADNGREIISGSAGPEKQRIILILNILKEATLPHPSTTVVGIFATHLIFPPFLAAILAALGRVLGSNPNSFETVKLTSCHWYIEPGIIIALKDAKGGNRAIKGTCKTLLSYKWSIYFSIDRVCLSFRNNVCPMKHLKFPLLLCALTFVMLKTQIATLQFIFHSLLCNLLPKFL